MKGTLLAVRILFVVPMLHAPSQVWIHRMLEQLGDEVILVAAGRTQGDTQTALGQPVFNLDRFERGRALAARAGFPGLGYRLNELRAEIKRLEVDTVLMHYGPTALLLDSILDTSLRKWVHFHGYDAMFDLRREDAPGERVHAPSYKSKIVEVSNRIGMIANSEFTAQTLIQAGVSPAKVRVKTLGVPLNHAVRSEEDKPVHVISVGRMIDCKGPDLSVRAFIRACELGFRGRLTMVGAGPMLPECESLAKASPVADRIQLLGAMENEVVQKLLAEADVFTQHNIVGPKTGQIEAFGVSVLEGMGAGLATVTTANGGVAEIVVADDTTLVIPEGDIEAQAQAFLKFESDPALRVRLGENGRRRARTEFSLEAEGTKLRAILESQP